MWGTGPRSLWEKLTRGFASCSSPPPSCTEPCLPGLWVNPRANPTEVGLKSLVRLGTWVGVGERWAKEGVSVGGGGWEGLASGTAQPLMSPPQSSQKKSCAAEPEVEPEAHEGDGDKKGSAEGSSDEEGKLVIDEPAKEKNEKGTLKRRAGDVLEVNASMCSLAL